MAVLSGAKYFSSNSGMFLVYGTTPPVNQDTMPDGNTIPDSSIYSYKTDSQSSLYTKSNGAWILVGYIGPGSAQQGVYGLVVTGTNTAFLGANAYIVSVDTNSVYLFSPTVTTGANGLNPTLTILTTTAAIQKDNGSGTLVNVSAGDLQPGVTYAIVYNGSTYQIAGTASQLQADWNQTNVFSADFIRNKPILPTGGTYTPTSTSLVNIAVIANHSVAYIRTGNIVQFNGTATITTSGVSSSFNTTLPFATASVISYGTLLLNKTSPNQTDAVSVNGASGLSFTISSAGGNYLFHYSGMYIIS